MSFFEKGELKLLWRIYFGGFLTGTLLLAPAFGLVYLIGLGMTLTKAGFLFALSSAAAIIFEIPTGAIADKYGRKFSVLLGYIIEALLFISLFFVKEYYLIATVFFLLGAAGTLSTGSGESWIYDLITKRNKKILQSYYSKNQIFTEIGLILSGLIGAFVVAKFGISYIWIISGAAYLIYFVIIFSLEEVYTTKKEHKEKFKEIWAHSINSIKYTFNHKTIFWLFFAGFFVMFAVAFSDSLAYIPYLKSLGFPDYAFGYFASGLSLMAAIAPMTIKFFNTKSKETKFLVWTTLLGSLFLGLLYFANGYMTALILIYVSLFFFCLKYPVEQPFLNSFIPTKKRATILSVKSMLYSLGLIISMPLGGYLIDNFGALNVIILSAILGIPSIIAYLMIKDKK